MTIMKSIKKINSIASTLLLVVMCFMFAACPEPDSDKDSGLKGWYLDLSSVAKQSDFDEINEAIRNQEVLKSYKNYDYVASRDLFIDNDGRYSDTDSYFGRLRFSIQSFINVVRILDDQTLVFYIGYLYEDGASSDEALYSFYAGSIFGNMTYYGTSSYYTYAKVDNKLIVSNGDIYTITSSGLIKDGSSALWSKYNPKKGNTGDNNNQGSNQTTGTIRGHKYVDLGLSVKWATCNIGADSPEEFGDYFAWGETSTKSEYTSDNSVTYGTNFSDIAGNSNYDAARVNWGGSWRLPTKAECRELKEECTWTWTTKGGHNGYKVVGPNDNSIFLPAAGYRDGTSLYRAGEYGDYWSSTSGESSTQSAYYLNFYSGGHDVDWYYRSYGRTVRPVSE